MAGVMVTRAYWIFPSECFSITFLFFTNVKSTCSQAAPYLSGIDLKCLLNGLKQKERFKYCWKITFYWQFWSQTVVPRNFQSYAIVWSGYETWLSNAEQTHISAKFWGWLIRFYTFQRFVFQRYWISRRGSVCQLEKTEIPVRTVRYLNSCHHAYNK